RPGTRAPASNRSCGRFQGTSLPTKIAAGAKDGIDQSRRSQTRSPCPAPAAKKSLLTTNGVRNVRPSESPRERSNAKVRLEGPRTASARRKISGSVIRFTGTFQGDPLRGMSVCASVVKTRAAPEAFAAATEIQKEAVRQP